MVKQIRINADQDAESAIVSVSLAATNAQEAVFLLNEYLTEAVEFTKRMQARQIGSVANSYLRKEVEQMDGDIATMEEQFRRLAMPPPFTNKLAQIGGQLASLGNGLDAGALPSGFVQMETERLHTALGELADLLSKYTERHPLVQRKRSEIESIESEISGKTRSSLSSVAGLYGATQTDRAASAPELDLIRSKLLSLEGGRVELVDREREARLLAADPPGICRVFAPATPTGVRASWRWLKIGVVTCFGMLLGLGMTLGLVTVGEFVDRRLKTADDVRRVTRLPVLGSLGNLARMNPKARMQWAFRTWTMLQGRLSPSVHHGLVCGITSSSEGEGRSTWIRLLAEAASLTGFRVLTIATRPYTPEEAKEENQACDGAGAQKTTALQFPGAEQGIEVLAPSALSSPGQVADQLCGPNSPPVVHIPLPGWVWNLERRKQWLDALEYLAQDR